MVKTHQVTGEGRECVWVSAVSSSNAAGLNVYHVHKCVREFYFTIWFQFTDSSYTWVRVYLQQHTFSCQGCFYWSQQLCATLNLKAVNWSIHMSYIHTHYTKQNQSQMFVPPGHKDDQVLSVCFHPTYRTTSFTKVSFSTVLKFHTELWEKGIYVCRSFCSKSVTKLPKSSRAGLTECTEYTLKTFPSASAAHCGYF